MRVGIIGAGLQGRRRAQAIKRCSDQVSIVADIHLERAQLLASELGCEATANWEDVVTREDVDAVIVCTPPNLHLPMCAAALRQGKHVLCEKPLARNPDEAEEILKASQEPRTSNLEPRTQNLVLKCGFNLRHHPGIKKAREWFDNGIIGELSFIRCRYGIGGRPGYEKEWRANREISGGGQLMDQGMHALDLSRWFMGEFSEVFGFIQTYFWTSNLEPRTSNLEPRTQDIGHRTVEDNAFCLLRTEKGQVASLHVSWTQWKNLFSFELFGKDGYITVEGLGGGYGTERAILGKRALGEPFQEEIIEFRGEDRSWVEEWKEFTTAIKESREPSGSGCDGLEALKLAYAIYQSARSGTMVRLAGVLGSKS